MDLYPGSSTNGLVFGIINAPPLILSFGVAMTAIKRISSPNKEYQRVYWGILASAVFVMLSCILNLVNDEYDGNFIYAAAVFDFVPPLFTWWMVFDLIVNISYPRKVLDNMNATKKQTIFTPNTRAKWYFLCGVLVIAILTCLFTFLVGAGLVFLNFATIAYFLAFLFHMKQSYQDVRPLGRSFWVLVGFVVFGNTLGSIVLGILPFFLYTSRYSSSGFALGHAILSVVFIKYAAIFAMITVIFSFPKYWIHPIREAIAQYDMVGSEQEDLPSYQYQQQQQNYGQYHQQQYQSGNYNVPASYPMLEHTGFHNNNEPSADE